MTGTIARVLSDKGYGFITTGPQDYFFHKNNLAGAVAFDALREGMAVSFQEDRSSTRGLRALVVSVVPTAAVNLPEQFNA